MANDSITPPGGVYEEMSQNTIFHSVDEATLKCTL